MNCKSAERDYSLDNIRCFLIFSVVLAHLLEVCEPFFGSAYLYQFTYAFHMPVFIFLFGYNARYAPNRIIFRWCVPYAVFQCLYILFSRSVLNGSSAFQFSTPYWLLWYMLACIYYQLLLPLFDTEDRRKQILVLLCTYLISLLIGFEGSVGYYMSLSRFFVFQPWFLLGYYCKRNSLLDSAAAHGKVHIPILLGASAMILVCAVFYIWFPTGLLYGSKSYFDCGGAPWMRVIVSVNSFSWILLLFVGMKPYWNKPLFLLTGIGQNTLPVFLLHGFLIKAIPVFWPYLVSSPWRVLLTACIMLILLGNKFMNKAIYYLSFSWLERISLLK